MSITEPDLPIAIVGAGFSGTLLAINLLRLKQRVVLIERDPDKLAKGQAFGTRRPEHLLNVRASNMSAFPDDLGHFCRWMGFSSEDQRNRFVPRLAYGQYLSEQLIEALKIAPRLAEVCTGEVVSALVGDRSIVLGLASGRELPCRAVVLALGNFAPSPLPALRELPAGAVSCDPWNPTVLDNLTQSSHVLLVGAGLTAIDVALSLEQTGFTGRITALSRRGLHPLPHSEFGPTIEQAGRPQQRGASLLQAIRARAVVVGWRQAVDELRPHTQDLWRLHSAAEQRRFLRHARAYWDIHRHRLAPTIDNKISALESTGRLTFVAGQLVDTGPTGERFSISYRPRGTDERNTLIVDRIVNCTGPDGDLRRVGSPLLADLLANGFVRADVHNLGLDVDRNGRARNIADTPQDRIFAVGPITKGEAWEIVAVPDIRRQVWHLARYLAHAHWVGGEGL